jgi:threonine dehydrogenase-like Zn-dependent dehydrogenase
MAMMNAVRFYGQRDLRLDNVPIPECKPGHVKIAPKFCGICGSDLHEYLGGANVIPQPGHPHPITKETLPLTLGHEFSGVIKEVGDGVMHVKPGDNVSVRPSIYDRTCPTCKRGLEHCCDNTGFVGLSGWGGGLCEYVVVPASCAKLLPSNVPLEIGALIEPLAVGWHAVDVSPYKESDSVLVLGAGPIGLGLVQVLLGRNCSNIIVSAKGRKRKETAIKFGAHHVIDLTEVDVVQEVFNLTNGEGVELAFDAAGSQAGVDTAFMAMKARGTFMNLALWEQRATLNMNDLLFREKGIMSA